MLKIKKAIGYILYTFIGGGLPHYGLGLNWKIAKRIRAFSGKLLFDYCGVNVDIGRKAKLSQHISLGDNSGIGDGAYLQGTIRIGNNVMMAPNVAIIASNHRYQRVDIPMNLQGSEEQMVEIKDDVWVGYGAIILPGVTIEKGAIIAAGSVVTSNVSEFSVVGGVPAKVIKNRRI